MKTNFVKLVAIVLVIFCSATFEAAAQEQPSKPCPSSQIEVPPWPPGPEPKLAEVSMHGSIQLIDCGYLKGCIQIPVAQGSLDLIDYQQGKWTCGYVVGRTGSGSAWIHSDTLHQVTFDLHPALGAWVGNWVGGDDRVAIRKAPGSNMLLVAGRARWRGGAEFPDSFGFVRAAASPSGNRLLVSASGCTVYLTLIGHYIVAFDNGGCGAMNVHFNGIWKQIPH